MKDLLEISCGLDVHKDKIVACILSGPIGKTTVSEIREFTTLIPDMAALRDWIVSCNCHHVAMESTGIYWQPIYEILEDAYSGDITLLVVNARHMKNVPGKKTDMRDSEWIATLLRAGLLNGSFIPDKQIREFRYLNRYRKSIIRDITSQKNRVEKFLQSSGFRLSTFISEIFGYVLNFLYGIFNNYGIAIIVFSVLLRIILIPITIKQQKALKKNAKLQKEMKEIQEKYRSNPERLNQETIELYKREKMGPFSGCLSGILQIVIILSVFWLVSKPLTYMKKINPEIIEKYAQELKEDGTNSSYTEIAIINKKAAEDPEVYINMEFLGLDLSKVPTQSLDDYKVYIIPILYVISSIISIKLTTKMSNKNNTKKEKKLLCEANDKDNIKEEKQPDEMEMMQQMNNNMSYMMPIMSVLIAIIAPLGLALYWFISNVLMIIERLIIDKFINQKEEIENE